MSKGHKGIWAGTWLIVATLVCGLVAARADEGMDSAGGPVRVMTQNMDEGTDFLELIAATSFQDFLKAVTTTYENILGTKPAERAAAMAREIAKARPDLVGLQEASILRTGPITQPPVPATSVQMDLLQSLLSELKKLGQHYDVVAIVPGVDAQAPSTLGLEVRITTQDAIIARRDLEHLTIQVQVQRFLTNLTIDTPVGQITIPRGWASIDAMIRGRPLRFVTTHLEPNSPAVQKAQAIELVANASDTTTFPVVFAGDFNAKANNPSDPTFDTYRILISAGFVDTWSQAHPSNPGFTCCQAPNLLNANSTLTDRIDLVLFRGALAVADVSLVGNQQTDRTPSGLWPSDHAGVLAIAAPTTAEVAAAVH
jgi:endonuclease/exonuclease/phosphatase family metal-dependent hydrolase